MYVKGVRILSRIFYIMGKSASGKDSVYKRLITDLNLNPVIMYTTRPMRKNEQNGREYYFVSHDVFEKMCHDGEVIESRTYNTVYGEWIYFTADNSINTEKDSICIGTPESYLKVRERFGSMVVPVYIEVDDGVRLIRAVERERSQKEPRYKELCRRFIADCDDFSEENLYMAGITKRFVNDDFNLCINQIKKYICGEKI